MTCKDMKAVLKAIKKHSVKQKSSVVKVISKVDDVGKAIGVKYKGDKSNMFNVLSRAGRKNNGEKEK